LSASYKWFYRPITQLVLSNPSHLVHTANLRQCSFQDLVEGLNCTIRLRVVWGALLMMNFKFLSQGFNSLINKMCTLITHKDLWASKPGYDVIKYESRSCSCTTVLDCSCLCPSGQILCRSDDVSSSCALPWWVDRSHEVNGPFLKCL
jgi:hypothetical protein